MYEAEVDVALLGVVLEHLAQAGHEGDEVGLLAVEVHLLLVNLAHVKNLVDEVEYALGVMLDGVNVAPSFFLVVVQTAAQVGKGRHDERQRRAYVVRSVDEELHLLLVELFVGTATVSQENIGG